MTLRIAGLTEESIVDGPGLRLAVFAQGCPHRCPGCHNPHTHDPAGGYDADTDALLAQFAANPLLAGITLSGGEPFAQASAMAALAQGVRARGKTVWVYTGYTLEQLQAGLDAHEGWRALLAHTDVLVDGLYVEEQRSLELPWRGSRNQKVIEVRSETLEAR